LQQNVKTSRQEDGKEGWQENSKEGLEKSYQATVIQLTSAETGARIIAANS